MESCVYSTYSKQPNGYCIIKIRGKNRMHHRHVYCVYHGIEYESIADKVIMHSCDTRNCINPAHLKLGTQQENIADKVMKGRQAVGAAVRTAKLTEQDILEIRSLAGKLTCKDLGARYGVGAMQISRIQRRQRWAHVV